MNKLIKKIILIILLILLLFLIISKTYSTFYSKASGKVLIDVASWNILLNDKSVSQNKSIELNDIVWISNNSNPETVAPGSAGTFYISIDPNGAEVATKYELTFVDHEIDSEKILTVTDVTSENGDITKNNSTYTGVFSLDDIANEEVHLVKVTVEWINSEENNENDSLIGMNQKEPDYLDISFKAIQYNG